MIIKKHIKESRFKNFFMFEAPRKKKTNNELDTDNPDDVETDLDDTPNDEPQEQGVTIKRRSGGRANITPDDFDEGEELDTDNPEDDNEDTSIEDDMADLGDDELDAVDDGEDTGDVEPNIEDDTGDTEGDDNTTDEPEDDTNEGDLDTDNPEDSDNDGNADTDDAEPNIDDDTGDNEGDDNTDDSSDEDSQDGDVKNNAENQLKYSLYKKLSNLHDSIDHYIEELGKKEFNTTDIQVAVRIVNEKLSLINSSIYEYLVFKFKEDEYQECLAFYNKALFATVLAIQLLQNNKTEIDDKKKTK